MTELAEVSFGLPTLLLLLLRWLLSLLLLLLLLLVVARHVAGAVGMRIMVAHPRCLCPRMRPPRSSTTHCRVNRTRRHEVTSVLRMYVCVYLYLCDAALVCVCARVLPPLLYHKAHTSQHTAHKRMIITINTATIHTHTTPSSRGSPLPTRQHFIHI